MTRLEKLAKEVFESYSVRKTGKVAEWRYLTDETRAIWLRDVYSMCCVLLGHVRQEVLKPVGTKSGASTVFETGYNQGFEAAHKALVANFEKVFEDLINVEEF